MPLRARRRTRRRRPGRSRRRRRRRGRRGRRRRSRGAGADRRCWRGRAAARVSSTRSLSWPGAADDRVEVADRRHGVGGGGPQLAEERAAALGAAGFEATTRGSTSSSAARRLTKVVLASRMKSGSFEIASARASLLGRRSRPSSGRGCRPAAEMSGERSARAPESCEPSTSRRSQRALVGGELGEHPAGGREQRVEVLEARVGLLGRPRRRSWSKPLITPLEVGDGLLVEGVEDLVEVDLGDGLGLRRACRRRRSPLPPRHSGGMGQLDLAVGDAGQGVRANRRDGAPAKRRVGIVDREGDQGLAIVAELDLLRPSRPRPRRRSPRCRARAGWRSRTRR